MFPTTFICRPSRRRCHCMEGFLSRLRPARRTAPSHHITMRTNQQMGWVYLMRNKAMPGKVKIGFTFDDPRERANQLSSLTSLPSPFVVIYAVKTPHPAEL